MKKENERQLESSLKIVAKTSLIVFIGVFLSKVFAYLFKIIIARQFGPGEYGLFSLATMVLGLGMALAALGLPDGILRYIPLFRGKKEYSKITYILKVSLIITSISSILFAIMVFLFSEVIAINIFHNQALAIYLKIFSFLIPISLISSIYLSLIRAFEKISWHSFIINIFQSAVRVFIILLLILIGVKTYTIIYAYVLGTMGVLIFAFFIAKSSLKEISLMPQGKVNNGQKIISNLFSYSWPIIFISIFGSLFIWTDTIVLGYFTDTITVGIYNGAIPLAFFLGFASDLFMRLFFPLVTREYSKNKRSLVKELSKQVSKWIFLINIPLLLLMIVFPGAFLNIFFGKEFIVAENSLRLLAVAVFFASMTSIPANLISIAGKTKWLLWNTLFFLLLNLILDVILVQKYGMNGAAFATMIANILFYFSNAYKSYKLYNFIPLRKKMIKIFFVSLAALVVLFFVKPFINQSLSALILLALLFFSSYFTILLLTKCFDKNDLNIVDKMKEKLYVLINSPIKNGLLGIKETMP